MKREYATGSVRMPIFVTLTVVPCKTGFTFTTGLKFHCATFTMIPLHETCITTSGKSVACDIFTNHAARRFLFSGYNICYVLMPMSLVECSAEIKSNTAGRKQINDSPKTIWLNFNRKPGQMIPVVKLNQTYSVQPIIHQKLMRYIVTIPGQCQRLKTPLFAKLAY